MRNSELGGRKKMDLEPEELLHEQRWSSVQAEAANNGGRWSQQTDERLVQLVMSSTASGERFPVGVNCTSSPLRMLLNDTSNDGLLLLLLY